MGKVICIANRKGGVGKTSTAINLSAALGVAGEDTLLVDCDPQGNATSGIGVKLASDTLTIYQVLLGECVLAEALQKTAIAHLDVLPANHDLIGAEVELLSMENREYRLADLLRKERERYHYVLLDCPPSLGLLTVNALTAADSVLIPLQCEYYALEGLSSLVQTIEQIRASINPDLEIEGLLRTMFDPRNNLANEVSAQLIEHFGDKVFRTMIPRNVRLAEAPSFGKPALFHDKESRGALAYLALAGEMIRRDELPPADEMIRRDDLPPAPV